MSALLLLRPSISVDQPPAPEPGISVFLQGTWFHFESDRSDAIMLIGIGSAGEQATVSGETQSFGGGRLSGVRRPGQLRVFPLEFTGVSMTQVADLRRREGVMQMMRDPSGELAFGWFLDMQVKKWVSVRNLADVSFTFEELTASESR